MDTAYIYTLSDPRTGYVHYVGKAFNPSERLDQHWKSNKSTPSSKWVRSLKVIGIKPEMGILEKIDFDKDEAWEEAERFWIECLRQYGCPLKNLDTGGNSGRRHCEATKAKIAAKATGRKQSPELLARLSEIRRGRKLSEEHKKKLSLAGKGRPNPAATKFCKARKGVPLSENLKAKLKEAWKIRKLTPVSEETKAKLRASAYKQHTPEATAKWRASYQATIEARRAALAEGNP